MPGSVFADEILAATAEIDAVFAEAWTLVPCLRNAANDTTAPTSLDPGRPQVVFQATYCDPEAAASKPDANAYDTRSGRRMAVESGHPRVEISPFEVARSGVAVQVGDRLLRAATGLAYAVNRTFTTAGDRVVLAVNLIG